MGDQSARTWEGEWWSPADPERHVKGTLTFERIGEFRLDLEMPLLEVQIPEHGITFGGFSEKREEPLLLGRASGHDITVLDCSALVSVLPSMVVHRERWLVNTALIGTHLASSDATVFIHARMTAEALPAFADGAGVEYMVDFDETTGHLVEFTLSGKRAIIDTAAVSWGSVSVVETLHFRSRGSDWTGGTTTWFEADFDQPRSWQDAFHRCLIPLRNLLAVLLGKAVPVDVIELRVAAPDRERRKHIELLLRMPEPANRPKKPVKSQDLLCSRTSLPGGFGNAIPRWIEAHEIHRVGVDALTDALYAPSHYIQDDLVDFVRAVGHLLEPEDKQLSKNILDDREQRFLAEVETRIPAEDELHREVMRRLSSQAWQLSERERLQALIARLGGVGVTLVGQDAAGFARRIVATRNHLSHSSSKPDKWVLGQDVIAAYTLILKWLLRCTLLLRLGATIEQIEVMVQGRIESLLEQISPTIDSV